MKITFDRVVGGYAAFRVVSDEPVPLDQGAVDLKLAVITTSHHLGLFRNGVALYEPMAREDWTIHWTSPVMHLDVIKAVLDGMPTEPNC